jgi:transcriptional regulator with PAS, ATPase and Fis domain
MSPGLQAKLLRVIEDGVFFPVGSTEPRRVNVRVLSATNRNLKELVRKGDFREDLYYRINVVRISLPPLRERKEDMPLLVEHFIRHINHKGVKEIRDIEPSALKVLLDYDWPGNVRELENVIESAAILARSKTITINDLPEEITKRSYLINTDKSYEQTKKILIESFRREYIGRILEETGGNIRESARRAGLSRTGFKNLLKKAYLDPQRFKKKT